jgi:hypothetical protein
VGSIEPGKLADLIVVDGNPLDDMAALQHRVCFVMKGGTIYQDEIAKRFDTLLEPVKWFFLGLSNCDPLARKALEPQIMIETTPLSSQSSSVDGKRQEKRGISKAKCIVPHERSGNWPRFFSSRCDGGLPSPRRRVQRRSGAAEPARHGVRDRVFHRAAVAAWE